MFKNLFLTFTITLFCFSVTAEVTRIQETQGQKAHKNPPPPITAKFSTNRKTASSYQSAEWQRMDNVARANHIYKVASELINTKGYTYLNPWMIVCTSYRESEFISQWRTPIPESTASGLMQVTNNTIKGILQQDWFSSVFPSARKYTEQYKTTRSRRERDTIANNYRIHTAQDMMMQIELGIETFHLKRVEAGSRDPDRILRDYRGSGSKSTDKAYSKDVRSCMDCIGRKGVSQSCLSSAK